MKWITNEYNPKAEDAYLRFIAYDDKNKLIEWHEHLNWLKDKMIALPQATEKYTVQELLNMGMIGIYLPE